MRILMTKFVKKSEITSSWFEIDAKNAVVGRLATIISKIIRGKNKTTFTPHMVDGDFVVVKNIEKITTDDLRAYHKKNYGTGSMVVVAVGDVDHDELSNIIAESFEGWQSSPLEEKKET